MLRLVLIRHGQTAGNLERRFIGRTDEPLTAEGKKALAARSYPAVQCLFVSPLLRCRQTAALIYPDLAAQIVRDLQECDFGWLENHTHQELSTEPYYQAWLEQALPGEFPGGEQLAAFRRRACQAFAAIVEDCLVQQTESAAIIAHGGTIMAIMARFGQPTQAEYAWSLANGAYHELVVDPLVWAEGRRAASVRGEGAP